MTYLTRDELLALLQAARDHSERDWLLLLTTFNHGLRASEALHLTKANFRDGYLTVRRLKGSLCTTQPLLTNSNLLLDEKDAIESYLRSLKASERLFPLTRFGLAYIMKRHCRAAGVPAHKAHVHSLKHTMAMLSIKRAGIEHVRQYLGHRSISSTGEYLKVDDTCASKAIADAMAY